MTQKKPQSLLPDRTFERRRGCWNCTAFENGQLAKQHWEACKARDIADYFAAGNTVPVPGEEDANGFTNSFMDSVAKFGSAIASGAFGMCLKGKAQGDFVHHQFLCSDGWTGRQGSSVATGGIAGKVDKDIEELIDIADSRAKKSIL